MKKGKTMARYSVVDNGTKSKKKHKRTRRVAIVLVLVLFVTVALALYFYRKSMTPIILDIAQTRLKAETTLALNEAIFDVLANCNDQDFVNVEKNNQNDVVLISANSAYVNRLAREVSVVSQKQINNIQKFRIQIPIGTLSGIPLLSEKGTEVEVTVTPIGKVTCSFTSDFESAGINQTVHKIFLNVCSRVDLIIPTFHMEVETVTPILISESIIVGKVPNTFLQGGLLLGSA